MMEVRKDSPNARRWHNSRGEPNSAQKDSVIEDIRSGDKGDKTECFSHHFLLNGKRSEQYRIEQHKLSPAYISVFVHASSKHLCAVEAVVLQLF